MSFHCGSSARGVYSFVQLKVFSFWKQQQTCECMICKKQTQPFTGYSLMNLGL